MRIWTQDLINPVPEIIDPVFAKTSPKRSFCVTENERFGLVFVKTGSINSGTGSGREKIGSWVRDKHPESATRATTLFLIQQYVL